LIRYRVSNLPTLTITSKGGSYFKTKKNLFNSITISHTFVKVSSMASSMSTENQQPIQGKNYRQTQKMIEDACRKAKYLIRRNGRK